MFVGRNSIAKLLDFKTSDFEYTVVLLYKNKIQNVYSDQLKK